ncbi:siroheme synthase [Sphingomonas panacisoli]|uniref:precorrin-2 dehydrogenase n=1 Tax=Sphingomonas panacisoli TaxID=1813879 RepID=A0A5B8LNM0_9SPHN|nr:siroheme synthase [Sphingomonas panacisoli]
MHSLPVFVRLEGRPVMLIGEGDAADAKRRLLERAGAVIVGEDDEASLAIVAMDAPEATVARLKARGVLVNAVDRSDLCDFTLPAIVDRSPVIVAVGTGGASAGLAGALRQRLETMLPADLGDVAEAAQRLREKYPESGERRLAIGELLDSYSRESGNPGSQGKPSVILGSRFRGSTERVMLASHDPDDLTLRQARALAQADRVLHAPDVPAAILDRARADAPRIVSPAPPLDPGDGLTVYLEMAR